MRIGDLKPAPGAKRRRKRVGCGPGSGLGKTSGRGNKGAGQHSASEFDARFEGGQMPFYRRIPKRGFNRPHRESFEVVNVGDFARIDGDVINVETLRNRRLVRGGRPVKVLGGGEVARPLTVSAHAFTKSARDKIEKAGGRVEVVG